MIKWNQNGSWSEVDVSLFINKAWIVDQEVEQVISQ